MCAEDTKSISSSHTSGIVMDCPVSPKLIPACCCALCSGSDFSYGSTSTHDHMEGTELSMPSANKAFSGNKQSLPESTATGASSCLSSSAPPCPPPSTTTSQTNSTTDHIKLKQPANADTADTTIDEPLILDFDLDLCRSSTPVHPARLERTSLDFLVGGRELNAGHTPHTSSDGGGKKTKTVFGFSGLHASFRKTKSPHGAGHTLSNNVADGKKRNGILRTSGGSKNHHNSVERVRKTGILRSNGANKNHCDGVVEGVEGVQRNGNICSSGIGKIKDCPTVKGPKAPTKVCVSNGRRGGIVVHWSPVK